MLTKRIIPCLDIRDGKTVKGVEFLNVKDVGDPVDLALRYAEQGADELVFLDITATHEKRKTLVALVTRIAKHINIPFTVGGGISSVEDVDILLDAGADKISVNSAGLNRPELLEEIAGNFGSQSLVLAIDTRFENGAWYVYINGGRIATQTTALSWAVEATRRGAGEILLTSMNHDGTKKGFAIDIIRQITEVVNTPVIASGGAGVMSHFLEVFVNGYADAALAASLFHSQEMDIPSLKQYLLTQNVPVRV